MTKEQMVAAFNEWMRQFTEEPEAFEQQVKTVKQFLAEEAEGVEPSYGQHCAAMMEEYAKAAVSCGAVE
jgi:hypothetical protein